MSAYLSLEVPGMPLQQRTPTPVEALVTRLQRKYRVFNRERLTWEDAVTLAAAHGIQVELRRAQRDAILSVGFGPTRILVSDRLSRSGWAVFSVVHELAHYVGHPGPRDYYLCSPGWHHKTESQANVVGLLALWPRPGGPYPKVLKIEPPAEDGLISFVVAYPVAGHVEIAGAWTTRTLMLQRYR